ncbi:alpha/beta-hydrolase [Polyplosphaeria fusca]|uniref:Alpha/beta-hydrolase n=1 Tax=Polyplosphaeria fusca TaxID=682080 RepID=A0A9P4QKH3_9PLEO|nr:alpha/beta-hydrolase [Polyplosphaeria fusca]
MASQPTYDSSRWQSRIATLTPPSSNESIRINYIDCPPPSTSNAKGTICLIHGFPQTSYQFRHVIMPLSDAGYRVIAPDYRGAGQSSKPLSGYTKSQMASDIHTLLHTTLSIPHKIHIVGHDIGGMIAFAYARLFPSHTASLTYGECPLPGTTLYDSIRGSPDVFHFLFHRIPDLPEALIAGREDIYLKHFFDKQSANSAFLGQADLQVYVQAYSQPGAMRAGLDVYRAFEEDARENREWVEREGKMRVPVMGLVGGEFLLVEHTEGMLGEMHEEGFGVAVVEGAGHYVAEENPEGFVEEVLGFVEGIKGE